MNLSRYVSARIHLSFSNDVSILWTHCTYIWCTIDAVFLVVLIRPSIFTWSYKTWLCRLWSYGLIGGDIVFMISYIVLILLLRDLKTLCVMDLSWPVGLRFHSDYTAQKMKLFIMDFFSKSAVSWGFGYIYCKNT